MAKKLTPAQKAAKTRKANQEKAMQALGFERKKVTRKRKPMTEEQKKAAAERLKLARENVDMTVLSLSTILSVIYLKTIFYIGRR